MNIFRLTERGSSCVRRHINWNNHRPDLKEDLAHLVQDIKRRVCGESSDDRHLERKTASPAVAIAITRMLRLPFGSESSQFGLDRQANGVCPSWRLQHAQRVSDVHFDRPFTNVHVEGDLFIGFSGRHLLQRLELARG